MRVATSMRALLAAALLLVTPVSASAITDIGRPEITRLYTEDGQFACTASYIFPYISDSMSWIVTAGHCTDAREAKRNTALGETGIINWRGLLFDYGAYTNLTQDLALGTVPDVREHHQKLWLADEDLNGGEQVYIHGFPDGIERVTTGVALPLNAADKIIVMSTTLEGVTHVGPLSETRTGKTARYLAVKAGEIQGGSSGCPILNSHDQLEGVLWGVLDAKAVVESPVAAGYDIVMYTPVSRLHKLLDFLEAR